MPTDWFFPSPPAIAGQFGETVAETTRRELSPKKGNHPIPVFGGVLRRECHKLFDYRAARTTSGG